ncbi:MAG: response regulator [Deltaproteobacteria bacterium]|nr:response regulator [Deltaproteobacteria bacterium]
MDSDKPSGVFQAIKSGLVLVVDHDEVSRKWLEQTISAQGYSVECAWNQETALSVMRLAPDTVRAVVVNTDVAGGNGQATLQAIRDCDRKARIIAFSMHPGISPRMTLAVLPVPLEQKSLGIALHLAMTAGDRRRVNVEVRKNSATRSAA